MVEKLQSLVNLTEALNRDSSLFFLIVYQHKHYMFLLLGTPESSGTLITHGSNRSNRLHLAGSR